MHHAIRELIRSIRGVNYSEQLKASLNWLCRLDWKQDWIDLCHNKSVTIWPPLILIVLESIVSSTPPHTGETGPQLYLNWGWWNTKTRWKQYITPKKGGPNCSSHVNWPSYEFHPEFYILCTCCRHSYS
jgi:hypothetical protein